MPGERVLIVEDEPLVRLHLSTTLRNLGYVVAGSVASGEEAISEARRCNPGVVLMDVRLSGDLDGIEAARRLRREHHAAIVFITAYADDETLERSHLAEASGYVVKPFTDKDIQATLATALARDGAVRQIQANSQWVTTILESIGDAVVVTDSAARIRFMNRLAEELTGTSLGARLGRPLGETLRLEKDGRPVAGEELSRQALATHSRASLQEAWLVAPAGRRPVDVIAAPLLGGDEASPGAVLVLRDVRERHATRLQLDSMRRLLDLELELHGLIGSSTTMRRVFEQIHDLARVDSTTLITGQSGTGKELVARAIHAESPRREGPFVAVNTAGLTDSLLASQLFGHKRGAFTGATGDQPGLFEAADGGTLFLDEIGDVPMSVQTGLLRVLDDKRITPLGATRPQTIDVRFLAATHRDLAAEVQAGRFRADLLYRIRVARVELPPLRERGNDLDLLASHFLDRARAATGKGVRDLHPDAWRRLREYPWPGNVRELKSALEHAVIRCRGTTIEAGDLPPEVVEGTGGAAPTSPGEEVQKALELSGGNRSLAARLLGISRATLYRRLAEMADEGNDG